MLDKKYNKALTVILIIVVIAIFVILGFWGYDVYRKYYINNGANEALQEFDNRIASRNNTATNNTSNDIVESNVSLNIDVNDVETTTNTISSDGKIAKQTYKGYTVVGKIEIPSIKLSYPVLNVAKSKLKRFITYKEIANTIFTRSIELLAGEKLVGRTVIQLGYGDLGEVLADRYSQYGARVIVIEPDVMKCIEAAEKGFTTFRTLEEAVKYDKPFLIVGASGYNSISKEVIEQLEDGTFITSGATADLNIFKEYEKEGYKYKAIPKYGTQYEINGKKITVLGNGRSVNLFDSEAIPNRSNDIFKASQLVVTDKIINGKDDLRNQVELDIVDKWIDESNILEEYYNLYFKRK